MTWELNTLDSKTQSTLHITTTGALAPGRPPDPDGPGRQTADGISVGEVDADDALQ